MRTLLIGLLLATAVAHAAGQTNSAPASTTSSPARTTARDVVTTADVLGMLKAGLAPEVVAAKVRTSKCECDTSPAALEQLKSQSVPDNVVVAMIESAAAPARVAVANLRQVKAVCLVNRTTDQKVFDNLSKKLNEWGRWRIVSRPEEADVLLVLSAQQTYAGSINTGSAVAYGTYATGTGYSVPIISDQMFLIAVEPQTQHQLYAVSTERRIGPSYTAGALVNKMRKQVEKLEKEPPK